MLEFGRMEIKEFEEVNELKVPTGYERLKAIFRRIFENEISLKEAIHHCNLKYSVVQGKTCLVKQHFSLRDMDISGRTNEQRIKEGMDPVDENGNVIYIFLVKSDILNLERVELTLEDLNRYRGLDSRKVTDDDVQDYYSIIKMN